MSKVTIKLLYAFAFIGTLHLARWFSGFESAVFCGMCIIFLILAFPFKVKNNEQR